jgi:L-lactate dehydrogenase complex protein LldF
MPGFVVQSSLNPWAYGHQMMKFTKKSFHELWKELRD